MSLSDITELSEREQDILRLVATGAGNKQIAAQLFISTNTVKVHLRNIFAKIGVTSRTEAAMAAIRLGLVQSTAVNAIPGSDVSDLSLEPEDAPLLKVDSLFPSNSTSDGSLSPMPASAPLVNPTRWLTSRQIWLAGAGLVVLIAVVVLLGLRLIKINNATPKPSSTQAPSITALPRWQARTSMPSARSGLAVVAYEDRLYAIGGESANGVTGAMERYNPEANSWEKLPTMLLAVADIQAVVIGGKIYVPGGRTASGGLTKNLEIYDPSTDHWQQGADLPTALSAYALVAFEGRLYLFGGWDGAQVSDLTYVFDPRLNNWTALTPLPTRREFAGAALAGGKIYVIGGSDGQAGLAVVEVYSPDREERENPWQTVASMPSGRYGMGISSVADIIYLVYGQGPDDNSQLSLAYYPQTDAWQPFETPPANQGRGLGMALLGPYLYVVGGKTGNTPLADILAYQVVYTVGIPVIIK
jgi:DNA-binding CsgD family transcriptional regulator/N-acetylneuraminic acid mutarotase